MGSGWHLQNANATRRKVSHFFLSTHCLCHLKPAHCFALCEISICGVHLPHTSPRTSQPLSNWKHTPKEVRMVMRRPKVTHLVKVRIWDTNLGWPIPKAAYLHQSFNPMNCFLKIWNIRKTDLKLFLKIIIQIPLQIKAVLQVIQLRNAALEKGCAGSADKALTASK